MYLTNVFYVIQVDVGDTMGREKDTNPNHDLQLQEAYNQRTANESVNVKRAIEDHACVLRV